jgi:lipopolysaccharide export system protein LptA
MLKSFRLLLLFLLLSGVVFAGTELELVAPGGGEADLRRSVIKYYASGSDLAVARWNNFEVEAEFLEYQRDKSALNGKGLVKITQKSPWRVLQSTSFFADLNREYFIANGSVKLRYDKTTNFKAEQLDWESRTEQFNLVGDVSVNYAGWKMTGDKVEGNMNSGLFIIIGSVRIVNFENSMRAGRVIFDRSIEKMTLRENPVVINGKNELSATEIVYDLKTKKVSASGVVKSRVIE